MRGRASSTATPRRSSAPPPAKKPQPPKQNNHQTGRQPSGPTHLRQNKTKTGRQPGGPTHLRQNKTKTGRQPGGPTHLRWIISRTLERGRGRALSLVQRFGRLSSGRGSSRRARSTPRGGATTAARYSSDLQGSVRPVLSSPQAARRYWP